jgi:hypothetical protein
VGEVARGSAEKIDVGRRRVRPDLRGNARPGSPALATARLVDRSSDFAAVNPRFDPERLRKIRFDFDRHLLRCAARSTRGFSLGLSGVEMVPVQDGIEA